MTQRAERSNSLDTGGGFLYNGLDYTVSRREGNAISRKIGRLCVQLIDHYVLCCIFLALVVLTWAGVGDVRFVSALGLILCAVGLAQGSAQVDLWILIPLAVYNLFSMLSSLATFGNNVDGYASTQCLYLVLYLLMACLSGGELRALRRLCVLWVGVAALVGVGQFAFRGAFLSGAGRLGGFLGNPNAMGIFLVVGWFAVLNCGPKEGEAASRWVGLLPRLEPVLLTALALTLSMGSFAAMAGGIVWLTAVRKRRASWRDTLWYLCGLLARATLGMGTGVLMYLAANRTGRPWAVFLPLLYLLALTVLWARLVRFLRDLPGMAAAIAAAGVLVAGAAVLIRPSALETFAERIEMMRSGLHYLRTDPLLGLGPYQWRQLDLYDGGTYFNTWHIHNALLHVGVELGWVAMAMLAALVARAFQKKSDPTAKAGLAAFCLHNLMDTSFFYMGDFSLTMLTVGEPRTGGKKLANWVLKLLFGLLFFQFAWALYFFFGAA